MSDWCLTPKRVVLQLYYGEDQIYYDSKMIKSDRQIIYHLKEKLYLFYKESSSQDLTVVLRKTLVWRKKVFKDLVVSIKYNYYPISYSEWVNVAKRKLSIFFQLCHRENKLIYNDTMMRSTLY